jgi:hypothetical protein
LGHYRTPRVRVGRFVRCLLRGEVEVVGLTDRPIPWPLGKTARRPAIIVYAGLARAIRRESALAVAHWWGVGLDRVWKWRKALGVGATTEGTSRLRSAYCDEPWFEDAQRKAHATAGDPARREKIAAARRGKPRPPHVMEPAHAAWRGAHHSEETRRKMSEAHRRSGTRPPNAGRPWTPEEDRAARALPPAEAARRTGRSLGAVYSRRAVLRASGGMRAVAAAPPPATGRVDGCSGRGEVPAVPATEGLQRRRVRGKRPSPYYTRLHPPARPPGGKWRPRKRKNPGRSGVFYRRDIFEEGRPSRRPFRASTRNARTGRG